MSLLAMIGKQAATLLWAKYPCSCSDHLHYSVLLAVLKPFDGYPTVTSSVLGVYRAR